VLVPLYLAELQNNVMFHGGIILFQEPEKVITDLVEAAASKQHPNQFHPHGGSIGDQKTLSEYASCLEIADKIGGEEIGKVPVFMKGYSHLELKIHKYQETRR